MGTRADFWSHTHGSNGWLGSIAWDGYPQCVPESVIGALTQEDFCAAVLDFLGGREDGTLPKHGWPWPWETSDTTDYAYVWGDHGVSIYCFGAPEEGAKAIKFPDMSEIKSVTYGERSGLTVVYVPTPSRCSLGSFPPMKGDESAFPKMMKRAESDGRNTNTWFELQGGISKREYATIEMAKALLAGRQSVDDYNHFDDLAEDAVLYADALIAALEEKDG